MEVYLSLVEPDVGPSDRSHMPPDTKAALGKQIDKSFHHDLDLS